VAYPTGPVYASIRHDEHCRHARLNPVALAIGTPGAAMEAVSYGVLARMINNVGRTALAFGLVRGQVVAIDVKDKIFHAALILGLARLGIVSVSARALALPPELGVAAVIADASLPYRAVGKVIVAEQLAWTQNGDGKPLADDRLYRVGGDDLCRITLTSGTTGEPRGIAFSHRAIFERNARLVFARGNRFASCQRFYCDLGFATDPGYRDMVHMLSKGGSIFYYGDDPEAVIQAFAFHHIQGMIVSPQGLAEYLKFFEAHPEAPCGLDHILTSGSALSRALSERVRARMCVNLTSTYGATETGAVAVAPAHAIADVPGAVGFVVPGAEIEIVDGAGNVLAVDAEGAVRIRTAQTATGYVGNPPEARSAFRDGWFYPGDVGLLRSDGILVIRGRETNVLNLGGDKVRPELVEEVLASSGAVVEAAAFLRPNDLGIAELWAAVVARSAVDEQALRSLCEAALTPLRFIVVDALPRNEGGKLERARLSELTVGRSALSH
jgi:acyl-coenzyme A synthetase/AMP-(fatty) acid ligase